MAATQAIAVERPSGFQPRWIISAGHDLSWFIGSVVVSYAFLAGFTVLQWPALWLFIIWALVFDGPHVFATFSRTYFDREERQQRARLLYGSLAFFAVGPVLVLLGAGNYFFFFAALWAYYHLVKQHYGFMVLYKKKNNDLAAVDNVIDRFFLLSAMVYPFVRFIIYYRYLTTETGNRRHLDLVARVPLELSAVTASLVDTLLWWVFVASALLFAGRQLQKIWQRQSLNLPKLLLLAAAIPLHWIVLASSISLIAITPVLTIWHNIQYHRLIWFYNKNRYQQRTEARQAYGLAATISRHFLIYAAFGLLFNLFYHIPRSQVGGTGLLAAFFWGFAFIHYYLDSKIWRVRRDPQLDRNLALQQQS